MTTNSPTLTKHPYGFFADPATGEPVGFLDLDMRHMVGKPLRKPMSGIWGRIFWWVTIPQYKLLEDILYVTPWGECIVVKAGLTFDGGSIPFVCRWLYTPDDPDCLPAFAVHDLLCTAPYRFSSQKTHLILWCACQANGARRLKANVIWAGVMLGGPHFCAEVD